MKLHCKTHGYSSTLEPTKFQPPIADRPALHPVKDGLLHTLWWHVAAVAAVPQSLQLSVPVSAYLMSGNFLVSP